MLFCFNGTHEWSLGSLEYTYNLANEARREVAPKKSTLSKRFKSKKQHQKGDLPLVVCQLFSEDKTDSAKAKSMAADRNGQFVQASSLNNTGINEVFEACISAFLENEKKEASKKTEAAAPAEATTTTQTPQEKEGFAAVWSKLMAKFVKGETPAPAEAKANPAVATTEAPQDVAPVA